MGAARLSLTEGDAPRRLTLQFPRMRCLESFTVGDGKVALRGSMGHDFAYDKDGKEVADPKDVYFLKCTATGKRDFVEVKNALFQSATPGAKRWS